MTQKNTGGSAFPIIDQYTPSGYPIMQGSLGMTLRDWFAGQALAGMLSCPEVGGPMDKIAEWSYSYADAMIKARDGL